MASSEYRIIFTATFSSAAERDKAYAALKTLVTNAAFTSSAMFKRADMTRDDYAVSDAAVATEKVI